MEKASLIVIVGPSGCGKDSLISYARHKLAAESGIVFCHRYITRAANAGSENHIHLTEDEFTARQKAGLFAMHWQSHGHHYGIGIEINQWLAKGVSVVVNGSRSHIADIQENYPELKVVWVDVIEATLRQRLIARGREPLDAIEQRLQRNKTFFEYDKRRLQSRLIMLDNNAVLQEAGEKLVLLLRNHLGSRICA